MIEERATLLSRVIPDAETAYNTAIKEAIDHLIFQISNLRVGYRKNRPDNTWTRKRILFLIDSLSKELGISTTKFIKDFKTQAVDIITIDNILGTNELDLMIDLGHTDKEPSPYTVLPLSKSHILDAMSTNYIKINYISADDKRHINTLSIRTLYTDTMIKTREVAKSILTTGAVLGLSPDVITAQLRPLTKKAEVKIRMTVRTLLAEFANSADMKTLDINSKYINLYQFIGVIDMRTSKLCRTLDGQRWKEVPRIFRPPLHPNCRSKLAPIPYGFKHGTRPVVLPDGTVKIVDANITYRELLELNPTLGDKGFIDLVRYKKLMSQRISATDRQLNPQYQ